jgi:hypothetical protein
MSSADGEGVQIEEGFNTQTADRLALNMGVALMQGWS